MPIIKVWLLPKGLEDNQLNCLRYEIAKAAESIPELGLRGEQDVTCLFPQDLMPYRHGTEVIIEVTGLFEKPQRTPEVLQRLAEALGTTVSEQLSKFPHPYDQETKVECFIQSFNPAQGFWTSAA